MLLDSKLKNYGKIILFMFRLNNSYGLAPVWLRIVSATFGSLYRLIGELNCLWVTCFPPIVSPPITLCNMLSATYNIEGFAIRSRSLHTKHYIQCEIINYDDGRSGNPLSEQSIIFPRLHNYFVKFLLYPVLNNQETPFF